MNPGEPHTGKENPCETCGARYPEGVLHRALTAEERTATRAIGEAFGLAGEAKFGFYRKNPSAERLAPMVSEVNS
jgi:hypothetical protein